MNNGDDNNFNSSMVQLKGNYPALTFDLFTNFNSSMVQLKVGHNAYQEDTREISIPLWYN